MVIFWWIISSVWLMWDWPVTLACSNVQMREILQKISKHKTFCNTHFLDGQPPKQLSIFLCLVQISEVIYPICDSYGSTPYSLTIFLVRKVYLSQLMSQPKKAISKHDQLISETCENILKIQNTFPAIGPPAVGMYMNLSVLKSWWWSLARFMDFP